MNDSNKLFSSFDLRRKCDGTMSRQSSSRLIRKRELNKHENDSAATEIWDNKHRYRVVRVVPLSVVKREHRYRPRTVTPNKTFVTRSFSSLRRGQQRSLDSELDSSDDSEIHEDLMIARSGPGYRRIIPYRHNVRYVSNNYDQQVIRPVCRSFMRVVPTSVNDVSQIQYSPDDHRLMITPQSSQNVCSRTPISSRYSLPERPIGSKKNQSNFIYTLTTERNSEKLENETSSDSGSDSSDSDYSDSEDNDSMKSNRLSRSKMQSGRLFLDYSKMLQSREEQKIYESERRKHEEESSIVRLVQKEVNKPPPRRKLSCGCHNIQPESTTVDNKARLIINSSCNIHSSDGYSAANQDAENAIKEKVREIKERQMITNNRNKVEVLDEREYSVKKEKEEREIKHRPRLQDLDVCRPPIIYPSNNSNEPDRIQVNIQYDNDFEAMYPKPKPKGCQEVYYIDLTKPTEIMQPKPFDVFERRIVPQPKKQYEGLVKVGGGWNTMNDYMERHAPVKTFVYNRELSAGSTKATKEYYAFNSRTTGPRR